jgi:hypothetical protein
LPSNRPPVACCKNGKLMPSLTPPPRNPYRTKIIWSFEPIHWTLTPSLPNVELSPKPP